MELKHLDEKDFAWECYRDPGSNLVYFVHRKCATCTYIDLLEQLNWYPCDSTEIDWEKDIVFGHIKDPVVKHRKGIVEFISQAGLIDLVLNNPELQKVLVSADRFDVHTCTIQRFFGSNALKVRWIPIDTDIDHKQETVAFIEQYSRPIDEHIKTLFYQSTANKNPSTTAELELYNALSQLPVSPLNIYYLDFDQCLYDSVINKNFEPNNYGLRISQLVSQGHTQSSAEQIADEEVANQAYLDWKF